MPLVDKLGSTFHLGSYIWSMHGQWKSHVNLFARVTSCFLWKYSGKKVGCLQKNALFFNETRDSKLSITALHFKKVVRFEVYVIWNKPLII